MRGIAIALLLGASACRSGTNVAQAPRVDPTQLEAFGQLPAAMPAAENAATAVKVALGRMLYADPRLSIDNSVSCASCHALDTYGVDHRPVSLGVRGQTGQRNAPTVFNAAGHVAQFWDGRAPTVEEQAKGPILNPVEMGMPDGDAVVARLKTIPGYGAAFAAAFPGEADPVTYDNLARAIGAFERLLVTPSRWDAFQAGDHGALTPAERAGLNTFVGLGCQVCHGGVYLGGQMFQKVGLVEPWPDQRDLSRCTVTRSAGDRLVFKVPSLRNIERTGPYFHDGQVAALDEAVRLMSRHQLGRELSEGDVTSVVTWLKSLTGTVASEHTRAPALP